MAEYARTTYNFNSRITLNDETTDTTKFVLVDPVALFDSIANNTEEELPTEPGIIDYGVKMSKGIFDVPVMLYASTEANMAQLIQNVKEAFHPDLLEADATYGEGTKYLGYHPLKWTETVGSTSRSFQVYLKSMEVPKIEQDSMSGFIREAKLKLKARDPRKYLQTQSSLVGAGTAANAGIIPTPVEITIAASGATSTSLEIQNTTTGESLFVGTALVNGDNLVIDTLLHSVKLNGTEKRGMLTSASKWWKLNPGNNTITINNGANTTVTTRWNSAWPL